MKLLLRTVLFFTLGSLGYTHAATLLTDSNNELIGANNVDVSGVLYDVEFIEGTVPGVFGVVPVLVATTQAEAGSFSQALLDQVFINIPLGNFDLTPSLTKGCEIFFTDSCYAYTPYSQNSATSVLAVGARNEVEGSGSFDAVTQRVQYNFTTNTSSFPNQVFAKWTLAETAPVPVPAAFWLFTAALACLVRCKKK